MPDVYKRQVLPFELVQTTYLKSEWQALHDKEERLEMAVSETEEALGLSLIHIWHSRRYSVLLSPYPMPDARRLAPEYS